MIYTIRRMCAKCGRRFTFNSDTPKPWPDRCDHCRPVEP